MTDSRDDALHDSATVNQLRLHAGASDTHIPRPLLRRAADEIASYLREIRSLEDRISGLEALQSEKPPVESSARAEQWITVWKDGSYLSQREGDDFHCRNDPDWLCSIPIVLSAAPLSCEHVCK